MIIDCQTLINDPDFDEVQYEKFSELGIPVSGQMTKIWVNKTFHIGEVVSFFEFKPGQTAIVFCWTEFITDLDYKTFRDLYIKYHEGSSREAIQGNS